MQIYYDVTMLQNFTERFVVFVQTVPGLTVVLLFLTMG